MPEQNTFTGGCLCGAIRYEASGALHGSFICHCRMCQRASGAPFAALFYMSAEDIRVTRGQPKTYKSSPQVDRDFCGNCGSSLFFDRSNRPGQRAIFVGSLDDPNNFNPDCHLCLSSAVNWLDIRDTIPRYAQKPEGMTPTFQYDPVSGKVDLNSMPDFENLHHDGDAQVSALSPRRRVRGRHFRRSIWVAAG